ncbi:MAG: WbqC family protein [Deltaproteobacteria bacterium]|nr:WbqC family protein [Deltaproteobacteria bacterium]MCW5807327.1 WbqC family protein [Deltaproteobacteria bacterium]
MLVCAHTPSYLPSLAYFDDIARAELFVALDDWPFDPHGVQHRSRVADERGEHWLTVPLVPGAGPRIVDQRIDHDTQWQGRTRQQLAASYRRAPHVARYADDLRFVYTQPWRRLADLDLYLIDLGRRWLGIRTPVARSSELLDHEVTGDPVDHLIAICRRVGGRSLLVEPDAPREFVERLAHAGIGVARRHDDHPVYAQHDRRTFAPHLGFLDLLFNHGEASREILFGPVRTALAG